MKQNNRGNC